MAERLAPLEYYKWHWKAFRLSRNVQRLHYVAKGFYRELLDEQFAEGFIPDDLALLSDICNCPLAVMEEHWTALEKFFPLVAPGQRVNQTQEDHRTDLDRQRAASSRAGKASAEKRAAQKSTDVGFISTSVGNKSTLVDGRSTLFNERSTAPLTTVQPEEKRREEKRREEEILSPPPVGGRVRKTKPKPEPDSRHQEFRSAFGKYFTHKNPSVTLEPWDGQEASHLARFLKRNPTFTTEQWRALLTHRARSPVAHGENLSAWIGRALNWADGPTDKFGQRVTGGMQNGNGNGSNREQQILDSSREVFESRAARRMAAQKDRDDGDFEAGEPGAKRRGEGSSGGVLF